MRRLVTLLSVIALLLLYPASATFGENSSPDGSADSLQGQLADATKAYTDAKARLDTATQKQATLKTQLDATNKRLADIQAQVGILAKTAYRIGPVGQLNAMLNATSPDEAVSKAMMLRELAANESRLLKEFKTFRDTATTQQAGLNKEINDAKTQTDELAKRKAQIQNALQNVAGGPTTGIPIPAPTADPAPRGADGSFPDESCDQDDPTTTGCLTPRTLHAYQQVRLAGFSHYAACWRQQSWGEHPLGRACDFAAAVGGFGGAATGSEKDYGNRLAGWLIGNADRLGVLYVIWYHQIWEPSTGWHYYKGDGTVNGDHMNHVHLSER
jgi:hypothetical protein